jgi:hypothetical protein
MNRKAESYQGGTLMRRKDSNPPNMHRFMIEKKNNSGISKRLG